jgi:hypothetical protein
MFEGCVSHHPRKYAFICFITLQHHEAYKYDSPHMDLKADDMKSEMGCSHAETI